jgi:limonene-1,2-epoxide hydrolase
MQEPEPLAVVQSYVKALKEGDVDRCVDHFSDEAVIVMQHGMAGTFRGREAIEEWHKQRVAANAKVVNVDKLAAQGDEVTLEATVTTDRLRVWRIPRLSGTATIVVRQGKIEKAQLAVRMYNPLEGV